MQTIKRYTPAAVFAAILSVLFLAGQSLLAQTSVHNTTTLAAAQAATDTTISLTSAAAATGSTFGAVQAGQILVVDSEVETLVSVTATSTIWNVQRRGRVSGHASGAPVYIGAPGSYQAADPPAGSCTTANFPKFWINIAQPGSVGSNGGGARIFTCGPNSLWAAGNGPWYTGLQSGNGATVTLVAGQSGMTFLFDRAAGIVYTLPPPYPGLTFDFVQTVTTTSNSSEVAVATAASQFIQGSIQISGVATTTSFACNGTSHVSVKQSGTTTGGILGGWLRFTGVSTTIWQVQGLTNGSGTGATPCSTTV